MPSMVNFGKIKRSTQCHFTFIFGAISENVITFVRVSLFPEMKNIPRLGKICFYLQRMLIAYVQLCKNVCYKIVCYTLYILGLRNVKLFSSIYTSFVRERCCLTIYFLITRNDLEKCFLQY